MVKPRLKKAFSFAEILVSMLILSVFFIASSKIITHRQKDEVMKKVHGFYECYWSGGTLMYAQSRTGESVAPRTANGVCLFTTARNNTLFEITMLYPNGRGVRFEQEFINTDVIRITPPRSGNDDACFEDENGRTCFGPDGGQGQIINYDIIMNNLKISSKRANIINERSGAPGRPGAVIITW